MDIKAFRRDKDAMALIDGGAWVGDIPDFGTVELKVRGLKSKVVGELFARKERAAPREDRERDGKSLTRDAMKRISREVLHEAVLIDWRGLTDGGKPLPFDKNLAREWCINPEFEDFADAVAWAAGVVDAGNAEVAEAVAGN